MNTLEQLLAELTREKFYGTVEVKFESGRVVLVRKTESIKLPESYRTNRGTDDHKS